MVESTHLLELAQSWGLLCSVVIISGDVSRSKYNDIRVSIGLTRIFKQLRLQSERDWNRLQSASIWAERVKKSRNNLLDYRYGMFSCLFILYSTSTACCNDSGMQPSFDEFHAMPIYKIPWKLLFRGTL
jgi:hypothetical protein